jgi:hypothetical protein
MQRREARGQRRDRCSTIPRVRTLKIDKDCQVPREWERNYTRLILTVASWFNIEVNSIKTCRSINSSMHYYVDINPPLDAHLANRLQFLAGDDSIRVAYNQARINSGLAEFNKLFERPMVNLRTLYPCLKVPAGTDSTRKR